MAAHRGKDTRGTAAPSSSTESENQGPLSAQPLEHRRFPPPYPFSKTRAIPRDYRSNRQELASYPIGDPRMGRGEDQGRVEQSAVVSNQIFITA